MQARSLPRLLLLSGVLALGLGLARPVAAESATAFLKQRHSAVEKLLRDKPKDEASRAARKQRLSEALAALLDFPELSKRALRDHWEGLSPAQRDEFVSLLTQLVEKNYQKNLESTLDFKVTYGQERRSGESTTVTTVAQSRKNRRAPPVEIDYTMRPDGAGFRVFDITTDGVSLVSNYRSQFNRIIRKDGWDALLERMRKRLDQ